MPDGFEKVSTRQTNVSSTDRKLWLRRWKYNIQVGYWYSPLKWYYVHNIFLYYTFLFYPFINFIFYFAVARFSRKPLSWVDKEKLGLAQYYIVNWAHGSSVGTTRRTGNSLNMSTVFFEFSFQRRTGFFLLQVNSLLWLNKSCFVAVELWH